jgi:hypothetical protein
MRHDDIRRLRDVDTIWLRFRLWLAPMLKSKCPVIEDFSRLSDHQRQDIGLPEQPRYIDWKVLRAQDRFVDFTR